MRKTLRFAAVLALLLVACLLPAPAVEALPSGCSCSWCPWYPDSPCQDPESEVWMFCWGYAQQERCY